MVCTDDSFCVGVAIYNADAYRMARGVWESKWLSLKRDTDDKWFLRGLIQFTVAVHHARDGNDPDAVGFARSAREYLDGSADDYRDADLTGARESLAHPEADPGIAANPLAFRSDDRAVTYNDLDFDTVAVAVETLAEELDGYGESVVVDAVGYAHREVAGGEQTQFTVTVSDFVWDEAQRGLVSQRLGEYVHQRRRREDDVSDLPD